MNRHDLLALKESIERSLATFGEKPETPGFERDVFEQLTRMQALLRQCHPELFEDDERR